MDMRLDTSYAAAAEGKPDFNAAYDRLVARLNSICTTEKESIRPENVDKIKMAFVDFLHDMNWKIAEWQFDELLKEKSGEYYYRADGETPNWFHEFRQILSYLANVREGLVDEEQINKHCGGHEVIVGTFLGHDSWEDLGKSPIKIYAPLEKKIHTLIDTLEALGYPEDADAMGFAMRQQAAQIVENIDGLTHKTPQQNEDGSYERKTDANGEKTGKLVKIPRFGGDMNLYYQGLEKKPATIIAKYKDAGEGMATRIGVDAFSQEDDEKYTQERRFLFGRRPTEKNARNNFPFLNRIISSSDGMLGILLVGMETIQDYRRDKRLKPENASPIDIDRYSAAPEGNRTVPKAFSYIHIFMERLENRAKDDIETRILLDNAFYPSLGKLFPEFAKPEQKAALSLAKGYGSIEPG